MLMWPIPLATRRRPSVAGYRGPDCHSDSCLVAAKVTCWAWVAVSVGACLLSLG